MMMMRIEKNDAEETDYEKWDFLYHFFSNQLLAFSQIHHSTWE